MQAYLERASAFAPYVLRWGLAAVILWFGSQQLLNSEAWTLWVPSWPGISSIDPLIIVRLNGIFELVTGLMLVTGFYARTAAFLLFLHLCLIIVDIGIDPTGVRDFGLAAALLAIALHKEQKSVL